MSGEKNTRTSLSGWEERKNRKEGGREARRKGGKEGKEKDVYVSLWKGLCSIAIVPGAVYTVVIRVSQN